jgi:hypothetical protein
LSPQRRLLILVAAVSALIPLSAVMLVQGFGEGRLTAVLAGLVFACAGIFGLISVGRLVVVLGRHERVNR